MNRLGFLWARWRRDEGALEALSDGWPVVNQDLTGENVALVGNARALANAGHGPAIDGADLVVRLNGAPMPAAESHGARTDWLAVSIPVGRARIAELAPQRVLWMTRKRKRLPWHIAARPGFYLNPLDHWRPLRDRLGAPPSTGAMTIDLLARSAARQITLYGFDFFASQSLTGSRSAAQVPHDFAAEAAWVRDLLAKDDRFRLIPL